MKTEFEKLVERPETRFDLCVECTIVDVTEHICKLLEEHKMTRSELAKKMGVTPGRVSQMLSGEANMELATVARALAAFDRVLDARSRRIDESAGEGRGFRFQEQTDWPQHIGTLGATGYAGYVREWTRINEPEQSTPGLTPSEPKMDPVFGFKLAS